VGQSTTDPKIAGDCGGDDEDTDTREGEKLLGGGLG
jgi:hypothetical protein